MKEVVKPFSALSQLRQIFTCVDLKLINDEVNSWKGVTVGW